MADATDFINSLPRELVALEQAAQRLDFDMNSGVRTGALLAMLAASKPAGRFLELGTGVGVGLSWLRQGMDERSRLVTVDTDPRVVEVARQQHGHDSRIRFILEDGESFLAAQEPGSFDLIFADAWPGKFSMLDQTLSLLSPGGLYVIDDLSPQSNWPQGHAGNVEALLSELRSRTDFVRLEMDWCTGLVILVARANEGS
jgi:predicted O-methyltransferase YrrM